ncbi:MAG: VOC family protein [Planctomycetota bacterium]
MTGTNAVLGGGGFHHVALKVQDFEGAVRFYKALGFTEKISWGEGNGRAVMLDTGDGNCLEIFAGGSAEAKPEGAVLHFALRTGNCDAALAAARAAGAQVTMEPKSVEIPSRPSRTPVRIAFCKGPGGEVIELFQSF